MRQSARTLESSWPRRECHRSKESVLDSQSDVVVYSCIYYFVMLIDRTQRIFSTIVHTLSFLGSLLQPRGGFSARVGCDNPETRWRQFLTLSRSSFRGSTYFRKLGFELSTSKRVGSPNRHTTVARYRCATNRTCLVIVYWAGGKRMMDR